MLFVAATHTVNTDAQTGIQTVVRSLIASLSQIGTDFRVVRWRAKKKALVWHDDLPSKLLPVASRQDLEGFSLLLPEVIYRRREQRVIRYARKCRMRIAAIFYDAIPMLHPEWVRREAKKYHAGYLKSLSNVDLLIPISLSAADQFRMFAQKHGLRLPPIEVCPLPGELIDTRRAPAKARSGGEIVEILCVSTLEPRKNHRALIEAFNLACAELPELQLRLNLVGDRYRDSDDLAEEVNAAAARNPNIIWHGKVTNRELSDWYDRCDFTVYPSLIEGFGIPIAQSLWNHRPCVCANFGTMAETARGGGCLMIDVRDPDQIKDALVLLATRPEVRQELVREIETRPVKTWKEYALEISRLLEGLGSVQI